MDLITFSEDHRILPGKDWQNEVRTARFGDRLNPAFKLLSGLGRKVGVYTAVHETLDVVPVVDLADFTREIEPPLMPHEELRFIKGFEEAAATMQLSGVAL